MGLSEFMNSLSRQRVSRAPRESEVIMWDGLKKILMTTAFALACGCGLSDYEKRMDEQRERMNLFDEENATLGDLIDMPSGKDPRGAEIKVPFEIYLRLPKGIGGASFISVIVTRRLDAIYGSSGNSGWVSALPATMKKCVVGTPSASSCLRIALARSAESSHGP